MERRRRGHCTGLLRESNRKDLLRECLIEWNLKYIILFLLQSIRLHVSLQICLSYQNDSIDFVRLERLDSPNAVSGMEGEKEIEW